MPRAERFLYPALLLGAVLIGLGLLRRGTDVLAAGRAQQPLPEDAQRQQLEAQAFREDLAAFRAGDDARLASLRTRAAQQCERWQRCDALDITAYYAGLSRTARLRGLEDEARGQVLRQRVLDAREAQLDDEGWQLERTEILFGLEELAGSIPLSGDRVPAAQAAALAANLRVEHLRAALELPALEREAELGALERDLALAEQGYVNAGVLRPRIELDWIEGLRASSEDRLQEAEAHFARCLELARKFGERDWQERSLEELQDLAQDAGDMPRLEAWIEERAALEADVLPWKVARRHALQLVWSDQPERAAEFLRAHLPESRAEADEHALLEGHCRLRAGDVKGALATYAGIGADSAQARDARLSEARALLAQGSATAALAQVEALSTVRARPELLDAWHTLHAEILVALGRRAQAIRELRELLEGAAKAQARLFEERDANLTTNVFGEVLGLHAVELLARAQLEEGDALGAACTIESAQASTLRLVRGGVAQRGALSRGDLAAWARHFELGLLTWVVGADESLVVLVAADGSAQGARIPYGRRALQEAVRRLREAVLAGDETRRERLGRELCSVLLPDALRDALVARSGTKPARACFLLHGPLEALPIEALEDGAWLSETIVPAVLPGLPASAPAPEWDAAQAGHWRLLGDPIGAGGERLLPGAKEELDSIANSCAGSVLATGADFGREQLASALGSGDCLHIATHVRHGGDALPTRTDSARFVLSGGAEFGLAEVARLEPHSALVVLTGCETGGGRFADAEGLQGLARAFLEGGTRNLVATSWPVEDRWARAFAIALHRALALHFTPAGATAEARRSLRAQGAPCSEWAAFRLIGQD